jgi:acetyltransferase-like isoleucine patch superfamily enzyme
VSGFVRLEEGAFLGSNAGVAPGFRVGAHAVVGGGSFVVGNVAPRVTMLGVPAARFGPAREEP